MARLLDDLLDVARINARPDRLAQGVGRPPEDGARSAIEALSPLITERGMELVTSISDEPIPVFGDPTRLQQVQANLLSNAAKYSPIGTRIAFEVRRDGNEAMIRVSDHGKGIEREILPKIFDLFVQGQPTLDRSDGGLGIGLTLLPLARGVTRRPGAGGKRRTGTRQRVHGVASARRVERRTRHDASNPVAHGFAPWCWSRIRPTPAA
jgi:two-component system CheB/CheR fusion protein